MTNSDSPTATTLSTVVAASTSTASSGLKYQSRPRKKRSTKMITIIDHNVTFKPKYGNKPDPGAPMITRPCTECGKKFWSWKALFGHMRCHPERQWRGINPPPNFQRQPPEKRIQGLMTQEDHEVAACLLLLANSTDTPSGLNCGFECSSCKKVFGSHQALGGHRASHKNVKGCFAITRSDDEVVVEEQNDESEMAMVLEGHKCSICMRVFSSGQALGGHKRCHWEKGEASNSAKEEYGVDLNLPAPLEYSSPLTLDLRLGL